MKKISFTVIDQHPEPILRKGDPGTEDNEYGFEGGTVIRLKDGYHLFSAEMCGKPFCLPTRLAHWFSADGVRFERVSTLYRSSADYTGADPRASLWSPMPVFNERENRWNLFYVGYTSEPNRGREQRMHHDGRVWRAVSEREGTEGIGGPYRDVEVVLEPGERSDPWEGLQGTDSFYPYRANGRWLSFYGSAHTQFTPIPWWGVGLAEAEDLAGPWTRCSGINPVPIHHKFVENPVVTRLKDGTYVAVYDGGPKEVGGTGTIGYSVSEDGLTWSRGESIDFVPADGWQRTVRTPLCLLEEEEGVYTVYYTAFDRNRFGNVGKLRVRISG